MKIIKKLVKDKKNSLNSALKMQPKKRKKSFMITADTRLKSIRLKSIMRSTSTAIKDIKTRIKNNTLLTDMVTKSLY